MMRAKQMLVCGAVVCAAALGCEAEPPPTDFTETPVDEPVEQWADGGVREFEDTRAMPTLRWAAVPGKGSGIDAEAHFRLRLENPSDADIEADIEVSYDLGARARYLVDHGTEIIEAGETAVIDLGRLLDDDALATMKYSGSIVAAAHFRWVPSNSEDRETISSPLAFFEPAEPGVRLRSETHFYSDDLAGDFRNDQGGRRQKLELEQTLGHKTNLRIVDGGGEG